jgi:hypothetical protein
MSAVFTFAGLRRPSADRPAWRRRPGVTAPPGARLREDAVLRRFARARLERVRRSRSYRLLTRMATAVRRFAPALLTFALLGLLAAGVWMSIAQYDEQRKGSASAGAQATQQSRGSGLAVSGQPASLTTDLNKSAERPRAARSPQAGITVTAAKSPSSITQVVSATVGVVLVLVPVLLAALLKMWPLLPLLAVAAVLVRLHRRRRQNRVAGLEDMPAAGAEREGQDEPKQRVDQPEMDLSEMPAGVAEFSGEGSTDAGEDGQPVAAGDGSQADKNPTGSQPLIAGAAPADPTAEGSTSGQRYTFDQPGPAQRSQYQTTSEDNSALSQRWQPDRVPSDEIHIAQPRVSIIGTTIWSSDTSPAGGADAPRQVFGRPAEGTVPPRLAVARPRRAASPRRAPRQQMPPQQHAAVSVSLHDLEGFRPPAAQSPADLTRQLEELREQNLMLHKRLAEAAPGGRRHRSRLTRPFTRRDNAR